MTILAKFIRNEAMKQDPPEIYGWRVVALAVTACMAGMLFGMDTGIISGVLVLPAFVQKFGLDHLSKVGKANLSANIVSTLQIGCFAGALCAFPFADKWGRRASLIGMAVVALIGIILQFASDGHLAAMYVGRFFAGVGMGAASMVTPLYISEISPRAIRGALTGMFQLFNTLGVMLAFWINYGSNLHIKGDASWMVPLAMQGLPAFLLMIGMFFCVESPRFLAKQDMWEKSRATLARVRSLPSDHPYIAREFQDICDQLEYERRLVGGSSFWSLQREMWLIPGNRKRAILSICLMMFQNLTGSNAINYYAPTIFADLGVVGSSNGLFATGVYGIVKVCSCSAYLLLAADSLGRRRSLLWTAIAQGCVMLYIGLYVRIEPPVEGASIPAAGYVALVCIYLFAVFFQFGWGATCWIYVSEIPSARLRSINVSLAAATQWLFNFVIARATPNMLATVGSHGYGTYLIFFSFCACMFIFTWFFIPETKGLSLEKMDELFGIIENDPGKLDEEAGTAQATEQKTVEHKHLETTI
ncbi:hypothetical protein VTK73DRAFT_4871 [Phialemonium thermophilum]|uniref:Major facilitator superfamily (MFS) profile domain-containing protein n=1 Tax=Phialemonium thermophilum TaxID=223376 RepID=A0ABR3WRT9_9PEZI